MGALAFVRTTVDGCLSKTQTLIAAVIITPHNGKYGTVTLYNGESTNDPQVILLQSGTTESKVINFNPPLYLDRGLYVDVGGDVDDVMIQLGFDKA